MPFDPHGSALNGTAGPLALHLTYTISYEPLFVIIGLGVALLVCDFAFGNLVCRRGHPTAAAKGAAPAPAPSTPDPSAPATPEELQDAADDWEYFKRTKCRVLLLSMVLGFASEFLLWMLAPFFPLEAAHRGVSTEVIGLVFACHPIALGVSSQLAPWLMRNVEPFVILQRTLLLQAVFIAGFGLAGENLLAAPFAACAATNRLLLGLMSGINEPCSQAITLRLVPPHAVAYAFGLIIAARFSAMVVGPVVGGALYDAGGFPLPFLVSGNRRRLNSALAPMPHTKSLSPSPRRHHLPLPRHPYYDRRRLDQRRRPAAGDVRLRVAAAPPARRATDALVHLPPLLQRHVP